MRLIKWVFGAVLLVIVLGVGTLFLIPTDRIMAVVADRFQASTGRVPSVGSVGPSLSPFGVSVSDLAISNAD